MLIHTTIILFSYFFKRKGNTPPLNSWLDLTQTIGSSFLVRLPLSYSFCLFDQIITNQNEDKEFEGGGGSNCHQSTTHPPTNQKEKKNCIITKMFDGSRLDEDDERAGAVIYSVR